jgi:kinesin family protein 2/24
MTGDANHPCNTTTESSTLTPSDSLARRHSFLRKGAGSPAGTKRNSSPRLQQNIESDPVPPAPRLDRLELVEDDYEVPVDTFTTLEDAKKEILRLRKALKVSRISCRLSLETATRALSPAVTKSTVYTSLSVPKPMSSLGVSPATMQTAASVPKTAASVQSPPELKRANSGMVTPKAEPRPHVLRRTNSAVTPKTESKATHILRNQQNNGNAISVEEKKNRRKSAPTGLVRNTSAKPTNGRNLARKGSNNENDPVTRQMIDKRSARRANKRHFFEAIADFRQERGLDRSSDQSLHLVTKSPQPCGEGKVRVFFRKRPIFKDELDGGDFDVMSIDGTQPCAYVHNCAMHPDLKRMHLKTSQFPCTRCFDEHATNEEVHAATAAPLVRKAVDGGVATLFMYGQTGSGKTHTMSGLEKLAAEEIFGAIKEQAQDESELAQAASGGAVTAVAATAAAAKGTKTSTMPTRIPTSSASTASRTRTRASRRNVRPSEVVEGGCSSGDERVEKDKGGKEALQLVVSVSFLELAGKKCLDLLSVGKSLETVTLREDGTGKVCMCGARRVVAENTAQLLSILAMAKNRRSTHATGKNQTSSRSHAVCQIHIEQTGGGEGSVGSAAAGGEKVHGAVPQHGLLTLVDCAGSERKEDSSNHSAERQRETAEINSSLHALKECVRAIAANDRASSGGGVGEQVTQRIPFRESCLTKVLMESFCRPRAVLAVIATVSPVSADTEHSASTLKTACMLAGTEQVISEEKSDVQLHIPGVTNVEECEGQVSSVASSTTPPAKWTSAQLVEWMGVVKNGHFSALAAKLPSTMDGKQLTRWTVNRFVLLCSNDARKGKALHTLFRNEMKRVSELKAERRQGIKEAHSAWQNGL